MKYKVVKEKYNSLTRPQKVGVFMLGTIVLIGIGLGVSAIIKNNKK